MCVSLTEVSALLSYAHQLRTQQQNGLFSPDIWRKHWYVSSDRGKYQKQQYEMSMSNEHKNICYNFLIRPKRAISIKHIFSNLSFKHFKCIKKERKCPTVQLNWSLAQENIIYMSVCYGCSD